MCCDLGKNPGFQLVLYENAGESPDVCRLVNTVTLRCAFVETCEGVRCGPGKVCKMKTGRPQCVCSPDCSHITRRHPVCGSDGKTYKDECSLLMARCMGHPDLEVMYHGECTSKFVLPWKLSCFVLKHSNSVALMPSFISLYFPRVVLQCCVSRNSHLCDRPDQQRSLRHVPHCTLPNTHAVRAPHLWQ